MTENLKLQPKKGILKNKGTKPTGAVMFDEANLNADPERGTRQKIDEPKTPYHHSYSSHSESEASEDDEVPICVHDLTTQLEEHQQQTEHREQFEAKRKAHYNEFQAVKNLLAKKGNLSEDESDSD